MVSIGRNVSATSMNLTMTRVPTGCRCRGVGGVGGVGGEGGVGGVEGGGGRANQEPTGQGLVSL